MATPAVFRFLVRPAGLLSAAAVVCTLTIGGVMLSRPDHTDVSLEELAAASPSTPTVIPRSSGAGTAGTTAGTSTTRAGGSTSGTVLLPGAAAPANAAATERGNSGGTPDAPAATTPPAADSGDAGAGTGETGGGTGGEGGGGTTENSPTTTTRQARPGRLLASDGNVIEVFSAEGADEHPVVQGTSPVWHPDGRRAAFAFDGAIWLIDVDNPVAPSLLVKAGGSPAWSPDGSRLAYVRTVGGKDQVWQVNADGSNPRAVVASDSGLGASRSPAWSPDGFKVVFAFGDATSPSGIATIDTTVPGSRPTVIATDAGPCCENRLPAWSADGRLAWLFTNAGGSVIRIMRLEDRAVSDVLGGALSGPAWAPDGLEIAAQTASGFLAASPEDGTTRVIGVAKGFNDNRPSWH